MNRPSLYGAFGDKRELYIKAYQRYRADGRVALAAIFTADMPLRQRLQRIFDGALDIYLSGDDGPRGCFTLMSVASDAVVDPDIRTMVVDGIRELDKAFAACFRQAKLAGDLPENADPELLAQLASATLHTLSIRARAGLPRGELEVLLQGGVDLLCGPVQSR
jgi:AcrR family transcriptional regulator